MASRTKLGERLGGYKMKGIEDFKEEIMYDSDLADYFCGVDSMEELVEKAREKGFDFTVDDLQQDELSEEIFESVCGGKGDQRTTSVDLFSGDGSVFIDGNVEQLLQIMATKDGFTPQKYHDWKEKFK